MEDPTSQTSPGSSTDTSGMVNVETARVQFSWTSSSGYSYSSVTLLSGFQGMEIIRLLPYSEKFWRTKKLANLANSIKTTKILVCQIFTPYELGRGLVENT